MIRGFRILPAFAFVAGWLFLIPTSNARSPVPPADSASVLPGGRSDQEPQHIEGDEHFASLYRNFRGICTSLLLLAGLYAAITIVCGGPTRYAIFVVVGALILFGGFWFFSLLSQVFSGDPEPMQIASPANTAGTECAESSFVSPVVRDVARAGLNLLATAITPFVVIQGLLLSIGIAMREQSAEDVTAYLLGAIVVFSANLFAQIFLLVSGS